MVLEISPTTRRSSAARLAAADALRHLPARAPRASDADRELDWSSVGGDVYEVTMDALVLGYVEVVGAVFVALAGPRRDRAVEVRQTLRFDEALQSLRAAHRF